jgi:hypothetical protein
MKAGLAAVMAILLRYQQAGEIAKTQRPASFLIAPAAIVGDALSLG